MILHYASYHVHVVKIRLEITHIHPFVPSFFPSSSPPDVLCDPTDLIWRKGTQFEAMTDRTAFIDGLLADVFRGFPQL